VLTDVTADMRIFREETFGPVAPLIRFSSDAEVIELANRTEYGLASYFYSRDIGRIWRVAEALEYGMVGVNTGLVTTEVAPFGGVKAIGPRPRRLEIRHRRIRPGEIRVLRRPRPLIRAVALRERFADRLTKQKVRHNLI
jgi:acyl-CoA reductase-like NAD-dependent aldehyde dehydrogenase